MIELGWVLTAAGCVQDVESPDDIKISVNDNKVANAASGNDHAVDRYYPHRQYNHENKQNDIALIKVGESFVFKI